MIPTRPARSPLLIVRVVGSASRALVASLLAASLVATSLPAHADDAGARQYFRQGVDLYDKKQYRAALESFQKAYAEKPSPGIKQNVALCLKGLGRPVAAATAFDEALDEGQGTLKPDVRAAIEIELGELSKIVGTVRLTFISASDKKALEDAVFVVSVDGTPLSAAAVGRPVRLEPGIHVFSAHAEWFDDPPQKRLSILAGSPVDATFEIGAPLGKLTIVPSVPDAAVQIDGSKSIASREWPVRLPTGMHRVSVSAPGYQTTNTEVVVSPRATAEYSIPLSRPGDGPPVYEGPVVKAAPAPKNRYAVPMVAYEGQSLRLSPVLGERAGGSKRAFTGASVGLRGGYRVSKSFALELHGEVGQIGATYALPSAATESNTRVIEWQLTPGLRFATGGNTRFTTGMGVGIHGLSVTSELNTTDGSKNSVATLKGNGFAGSWLIDLGMQVDVSSIFLEGVVFADLHGVGTTRDDSTNQRMLLSSPSTRFGIRVGVGIPF